MNFANLSKHARSVLRSTDGQTTKIRTAEKLEETGFLKIMAVLKGADARRVASCHPGQPMVLFELTKKGLRAQQQLGVEGCGAGIGGYVRTVRKANGWSIQKLSEKVGCSHGTIFNIEEGRPSAWLPTVLELLKKTDAAAPVGYCRVCGAILYRNCNDLPGGWAPECNVDVGGGYCFQHAPDYLIPHLPTCLEERIPIIEEDGDTSPGYAVVAGLNPSRRLVFEVFDPDGDHLAWCVYAGNLRLKRGYPR